MMHQERTMHMTRITGQKDPGRLRRSSNFGTGPRIDIRDQAVERIQNGVNCIRHSRLNAAIIKAEAGNWGPDDAQHAYVYHGPETLNDYMAVDHMSRHLGTDNADGTAATVLRLLLWDDRNTERRHA